MPPARLLLCLLCAVFALRPLQAAAQARPDHPFRADLSASGGWVSGNVGQAQATAAARVARARGDLARVDALRAAHAAAPGATRQRLWADSLRRLRGQTRVQSLPDGAVLELPPPAADRSAP